MKHPRLIAALLGLLLALPTLRLTAQDAGWPVETRCVGEPTAPLEGWTFPGAILMNGNFGIHAIRAGWETPHVVAFVRQHAPESAGLSPDGRWYAALESQQSYAPFPSDHRVYSVQESGIRVYSTVNPREEYFVQWVNSYAGVFNIGKADEYPQMLWMSSNELLYINEIQGESEVGAIIHPFTGEYESLNDKSLSRWKYPYLQPSPNWSFMVYATGSFPLYEWTLTDGEVTTILKQGFVEKVYVVWKPDSSSFASVSLGQLPEGNQYEVSLYDGSGNPVDLISTDKIEMNQAYYRDTITIAWNSNGRYLAYIAGDKKELHIADTQTKTVRNLCITVDSLSWSPDGKQLALLKLGDYKQRQQPVMIFDLERDQLYTVAYHNGSIVGWRED